MPGKATILSELRIPGGHESVHSGFRLPTFTRGCLAAGLDRRVVELVCGTFINEILQNSLQFAGLRRDDGMLILDNLGVRDRLRVGDRIWRPRRQPQVGGREHV